MSKNISTSGGLIRMILPGTPVEVTPNDDYTFKPALRAISIGAEGTLRITTVNDTVVNFASGELAVGIVHPMFVKVIHETGTTATPIKGYE